MSQREQYEKDLAERQRRHLEVVRHNQRPFQPCLHNQCNQCHGTGIKLDGSKCIHYLSCPCPKCSPSYCGGTSSLPSINTTTTVTEFAGQPESEQPSTVWPEGFGAEFRSPGSRISCNVTNCPVCS